jgi:cellobiose phosphorylase
MSAYGHFDPDRREYVITNPELPQPWHNYIANDEHVGLITHTGGGASYWRDPLNFRLLRYKFGMTPYDRPGRYVYIRDSNSGDYWSATWAPVQKPLQEQSFACHVGMGYNRVVTEYDGVEAEMLYFVPPDDALEIWKLTLTNRSGRRRRLRTFSYAEWAVWGVMRDLTNLDNASGCTRYQYKDGVFWHTTPIDIGGEWTFPVGYFTSNATPAGYDGSRDDFLGPCRDESRPIVVETGQPTNLAANGLYPLGGLAHDWDLAPGESRTIIYQLGAGMEKRPLAARLSKYRKPETVKKQLAKLAEIWEQRLGVMQVKTPEANFDTVVNTWLPYQVINFTSVGMGVSPVSWGSKAAYGFRDNGQGVLSASALDSKLARRTIEILSHAQHTDGTVTKRFAPPNFDGVSGYLDENAWYAIFVVAYLKETGDLGLLDETFPYVEGGEKKLLYKIVQAVEVLWKRRGPHKLPATGVADWNDNLNPTPRDSESVFNAMIFCLACRALEDLFDHRDEPKQAALWARRRKEVARATDEQAWDGAWYRRMFINSTGRVLGSSKSKDWGRIFIEPQTWAAICGALDPDRARQAMDSARKHLATPFGLRLLTPPAPRYEPEVGHIGILGRGFKENGSVYSHVNAWAACAEACLGRGDLALKTFLDYMPITRNDDIEVREIEPYAMNAQTQAQPFVKPGRGRNPWMTGSTTWAWLAATQYILGVKGEFDGLRIDPCIPAGWKNATLTRRFRGATYHVEIINPAGLCRGVKRLVVDGTEVQGNIAPLPNRRGQTIRVQATLEE